MALTIPQDYGFVLLIGASTTLVNMYHIILTSGARSAAGVKYPVAYASEELAAKDPKVFAFNCAQRAHGNFTEQVAGALTSLFVAGLAFPRAAAATGAVWLVSRVLYARGYARDGPGGRLTGAKLSTCSGLVQLGMSLVSAGIIAFGK